MKYVKFSVIFLLVCATLAFAAFSGKYLSVRKGGVTYKHRLYTSTDDLGYTSKRLAVRISGSTHYASLGGATASATLWVAPGGSKMSVQKTSYGQTDNTTYTFGGDPAWFDVGANGNIYVSIPSTKKILIFDSSLDYSTAWTLAYTPGYLVVDGSNNVYIEYPAGGVVYKYNSSGTYQTTYSEAVFDFPIYKNGYFYYAASGGVITRATTAFGSKTTATSITAGTPFAVDESDNVYWGNSTYIKKSAWAGTLLNTSPSTSVGWRPIEVISSMSEVLAQPNGVSKQGVTLNTSLNYLGGYWRVYANSCLRVMEKNGKIYWLDGRSVVCSGY